MSNRIRKLFSRPVIGRVADVHMWTVPDGSTSRIQAFRDETGRSIALITRRIGDTGISHINGAEMFRSNAWKEFFPDDEDAPTLIANVLDPSCKYEDSPSVITLYFDTHGMFTHHYGTDLTDIELLSHLGAEWDEGADFVPYTPPPPTHACVWRRFPVRSLPARRLFRDMPRYMTANWGMAVNVAMEALNNGGQIPDNVPPDVAFAARTLLFESIELAREGDKVWYINGQHRSEAMLLQGVDEALIRETRPIDAPPLPGEIALCDGF